jgi:hypothetical protein
MANLAETITYDVGVYQIETTDPVQGGTSGVSNAPQKNLANRTAWLKKHVDDLESGATIPPGLARVNSETFTGSPTVPTAPIGDSSLRIANTEFVQKTHNGILSKSVAGGVNVTLSDIEAGHGILVFTGALTANIAVIVPSEAGNWIVANRTTGAFTLTVKTAAGTGIAVAQGKSQELICDVTNVVQSTTDFNNTALTGVPTAPTPASGSADTGLATTGFVYNAIDGITTVSVAGGANVTLTSAQAGTGIVKLTGALTADINLILPTQSGQWIIANNSTGSFNVNAKHATGTGVVLPQGLAVVIYSDGTNVYLASSAGQASLTPKTFAPTAGTTVLTVLGGYTPGNLLIEKNGALLSPSDFTATTSPTITLTTATIAGDTFTVYVFASFQVADGLTATWGELSGTLANQTDLQNALNQKANTGHTHAAGDTVSGVFATARLGTGTASASTHLRGDGTWAVIAAPVWGAIGGTLANQTDLQTALTNANYNALWGNIGGTLSLQADLQAALNAKAGTAAAGTATWGGIGGTLSSQTDLQNALNAKAPTAAANTAVWGSITGTLSGQTDLQNALNAKANLSGATFTGAIAAPSYNSTSSRRYKYDIEELGTGEALSLLATIDMFGYRMVADGSFQYGVIAEELADGPLDFVVNRNEQGAPESVNYQPLFVLAARAVQGLEARLAKLEALLGE